MSRHSPRSRDCGICQTQDTHYSYLSRPRTATICAMSLLMHEIDGSEGGDNLRRVKRTRRVFLRPTYKASCACALRYSGAANSCGYVVERSPLLLIFSENFVQKSICNFSVQYKGCRSDSARLILRPEKKLHYVFGFGYASMRVDLNVMFFSNRVSRSMICGGTTYKL